MLNFFHPALAFGALLFAVPLVIHLLNRQRYRRREWAAMEFLLAAYKKQRRRLRAENLLLLLLRCLIPIALALAIARPWLRDPSVSSLLGGACHHVVLLDGSYSMGLLAQGQPSPWEREKVLAGQLLERVEGKSGHKVSLAVAGIRPHWEVLDDLSIARARATLAGLHGPPDSSADLLPSLRQVAELVERAGDPELRVYVFTDLQRRAFGRLETQKRDAQKPAAPSPKEEPDRSAFEDNARELCDRIRKKADLVLIDVAGIPEAGLTEGNVQITELKLGAPFAIRKLPVPVVATVKNRGSQRKAVQVTLEIDGSEPTRRPVVLDAGEQKNVEFPVILRELGQRRLRALLDNDAIPADNERFLVVTSRDRIRTLLVEGSSETESGLRDSTHIQRILDPTNGTGTPDVTTYATSTIDSLSFLSRPLAPSSFDLLVLCNVDRINDVAAASIKAALQNGAGVLIMLGSRCDPESYNQKLGADGGGPLPLRLSAARGYPVNGDEYYGFQVEVPGHPVFEDLEADVRFKDVFRLTPIYKFIGSQVLEPQTATGESRPAAAGGRRGEAPESSPSETLATARDTQVLARLQDPERSPLLIATTFGNGKALVLTTPIALVPDAWNLLWEKVTAITLLHPIARWLCVPATDPFNVAVGAALSTSLAERPTNVAVVLSERAGGQKKPVGEDAKALPGGRFAMPSFRGTDFAGLYTVEMQLGSSGASRLTQLHFAANVDPEEGDASYYTPAATQELLGGLKVLRGLPADARAAVASASSELGPMLLNLVLLFVLGEAALARLVSQRRT